ncbi:retrovirus-related pol polyprotein from transposon tnt 1-94 [Lasius niger]|uniref:Retrovirus-related pol polyprotein from transposon tnt 1-94 n=1 Tax=Lasius niger TaxID=67767 RepID=A0A0J7KAC3_LASNI|nr:retrovirus-related pol polyprotein from transposon tnt 1-94 [Lasius niger]
MTVKEKKVASADSQETGRRSRANKKDFECHYCKKKGHYAKNCRKKRRDEETEEEIGSGKNHAFVATCTDNSHIQVQKAASAYPTDEQMAALVNKEIRDVWITDSGASRHITHRKDWLTDYQPISGVTIALGDDDVCQAIGVGTVHIEKLVNGKWCEGRIEEVLYVPKMKKNLFSVGVCTTKGYDVHFKRGFVNIVLRDKIVTQGHKQDNEIYRMFFRTKTQVDASVSTLSLKLWHERLGHVNLNSLKTMVKNKLIDGVKLSKTNKFFCQSCQMGKLHRLTFGDKGQRKTPEPGEFIHSDICGPMSVESLGGARFYALFKDDASGFRAVYFLRHKSDLFEKFKEFAILVANKFGRSMKLLRADNGGKYCSTEMKRYLASHGIQLKSSAPYTPEQNGTAERDNRTIVEAARTMLHSRNLPLLLWAEAVNTAVYILNRTTCVRTSGTTPYKIWTGRKPEISHLRVFGSTAYMHIPKQFRKKLDAKAKQTVLVGYQETQSEDNGLKLDAILPEDTRKNVIADRNDDDLEEAADRPILHEEEDARAHDRNEQDQQPGEEQQLRDRQSIQPPARYQDNFAETILPGYIEGSKVYLALFVDDGLIAAQSKRILNDLIARMKETFEITLGDTSLEAVGSLMFLAVVTRPDIAFSVNAVSRHLNCFDVTHWEAVKRIFRYLISTRDLDIQYKYNNEGIKLEGYSDADYVSDAATRRSTTGYVFNLAGGPVSWESKRQRMVTLSTTEAEYVAAVRLKKRSGLENLNGMGCECENPTILHIDNQNAIRLVKNPEYHKRTKHIDIRYHYIKEKVEDSEIIVSYIPSELQRADILTKALP